MRIKGYRGTVGHTPEPPSTDVIAGSIANLHKEASEAGPSAYTLELQHPELSGKEIHHIIFNGKLFKRVEEGKPNA